MDLKAIREKLNQLNSTKEKKSDTNKKWKFTPSIGKQSIRILPYKYNLDNPFTELKIHYNIGKKTMISPANWGDKDPILDLIKDLRKTNDRDNWQLAKKLEPKTRVFVPIIVRGEEDSGVKIWNFGKQVYMSFLNLADTEDVGDFTDIKEGRDIILNTVGKEATKTDYNKTEIMPSMKVTPLSNDEAKIKEWLENQPKIEDLFEVFSYDQMKAQLQDFIESIEGETEEEVSEKPEVKGINNLFKEDE